MAYGGYLALTGSFAIGLGIIILWPAALYVINKRGSATTDSGEKI